MAKLGEIKATLIMGMLKTPVRTLKQIYNPEDGSAPEWILTKSQMRKLLQGIPIEWKIKIKSFYGEETEFEPLDVNWFVEKVLKDFEGTITYNPQTESFELFESPLRIYVLKPPLPVHIQPKNVIISPKESQKDYKDYNYMATLKRGVSNKLSDKYKFSLSILSMLKHRNVYRVFYLIILSSDSKEPLFVGKIAERLKEILEEAVGNLHCKIMGLEISENIVYLLIKSPSHRSPFNIVKYLRRKTSDTLLKEFPELKSKIQGRHLWWRQALFTVSPPEVEYYLTQHAQYTQHPKDGGENMESSNKHIKYILSLAGEQHPVGFLEAMGVATYKDLNSPKGIPKLIDLDFIREMTEIAEQKATTYTLGEFIHQHIESNKSECLAVLLPDEIPWGSIIFSILTLFNEEDSLTEIAEALRREGLPVYHNKTKIDSYNPQTKIKAFLFEDKHGHKIWFLKRI